MSYASHLLYFLQQAKDAINLTLQLLWSDTLAQVLIKPIYTEVSVIFTKNVRAILTVLIFPNKIEQKRSRKQSRDVHYYHLVICLTYTYLFAKSPLLFNRIRALIASLKADVDLSLVSMQICKLRDKKALYFETYTTF